MSDSTSPDPNDAPAWVQAVARVGLSAKGVVYVLVAVLAFLTAFKPGKHPSGSTGAMIQLQHAWIGRALLVALVIGLAAYATWRMLQALFDPEHRHTDESLADRLFMRVAFFCSSVFYGVMTLDAFVHAFGGTQADTHGRMQAHWTSMVLHWPLGRWLVMAAGLGFVIFCLAELYRTSTVHLHERLGATHFAWRPLLWVGRLGIVARAVLFGVAGGLLIRAGWIFNGEQAQGMAGALRAVQQQPYGTWLLGAIAVGLGAFGVFQFLQALLRPIDAL